MTWKMRAELEFQWDIVEGEIEPVFQQLLATVLDQHDAVKTVIRAASLPSNLRTKLLSGLDVKFQICRFHIARIRDEFAVDVKLLRRYASDSGDGSYISDAMAPTYRAASKEDGILFSSALVVLSPALEGLLIHVPGNGKNRGQIKIVDGRIADGALFSGVRVALEARMDALLKTTKT
ncbi:hypothetical protein N658DRAFT_488215 [Parathielavia hyrcaniae]|uniref:DUF7605 domain-containing protein n=1 Tax=Parathielavia hyrcaniae TaxID=113614 RepID=A0AAN6PXX9_9PEZI|nr:hypothetical protein N658DRAFT_488215 [Parathielavia hyrcaniae]